MPRAFNSLSRNKFAKRHYEAIALAMQDARFHLRNTALDQWQAVVNCLADAFAAKLWDPRKDDERQAFFRITPHRIQAWREVSELPGRVLMRGGRWLA